MRAEVATRRAWSRRLALVLVLASCVAGLQAVTAQQPAEAATASDFNPGNIISDENFFAGTAMPPAAVQSFLDGQLPSCAAGYTCLRSYSQATPTMAANAFCGAYNGSGSETAATIIARIGAACDINPRVLLVLLQKEQSLVTDRDPTQRQFDRATGFACPDTAPCDSSYGGFFYQVYYAARQFQVYAARPANYNHRAGQYNNVLYNPNTACGSSRVFIQNQATAGLYNYTPYQPNTAAMSNLYGTGDSCSAYGNRNFWRMWTDWFGSPTTVGVPRGTPVASLDELSGGPNVIRIRGWGFDPDTSAAIQVHVYIDGVGTVHLANEWRPDVGAAYPSQGNSRGFSANMPATPGTHRVCIYAINSAGAGANLAFDCRSVRVSETGLIGSPVGALDQVTTAPGQVRVRGWALDPDRRGAVGVHVYVGAVGTASTTSLRRDDVLAVYPANGASQGYEFSAPAAHGTQRVCAYAIDAFGGDANSLIGCRDVNVPPAMAPPGPPIGALDSAVATGTGIQLTGWAIDPDTANSIQVHAYVGTSSVALNANVSRTDVARAHPAYGDRHGYAATVAAPPGTHQVCVYGIDTVGGQNNALLGCRSVTVGVATGASGAPFGNVESVVPGPGQATLTGWIIDPDTPLAASYHVYVDGRYQAPYVASLNRPDVGAAYPSQGGTHGFQQTITLTPGSHQVCVYGIDRVGQQANALIACRTVTVP